MFVRKAEIATTLAMCTGRVVRFSDPEGEKYRVGEFVLLRRGSRGLVRNYPHGCGKIPTKMIWEEHPRYMLKRTGNRRTRNAVHARRLTRSHLRQGVDGGDDINYAPAVIEHQTRNYATGLANPI